MVTAYVIVSWFVPEFTKFDTGTRLEEPAPVAGVMFEPAVKLQFTAVPEDGTRLKVTGWLPADEQITWPWGDALMLATGFTCTA